MDRARGSDKKHETNQARSEILSSFLYDQTRYFINQFLCFRVNPRILPTGFPNKKSIKLDVHYFKSNTYTLSSSAVPVPSRQRPAQLSSACLTSPSWDDLRPGIANAWGALSWLVLTLGRKGEVNGMPASGRR